MWSSENTQMKIVLSVYREPVSSSRLSTRAVQYLVLTSMCTSHPEDDGSSTRICRFPTVVFPPLLVPVTSRHGTCVFVDGPSCGDE